MRMGNKYKQLLVISISKTHFYIFCNDHLNEVIKATLLKRSALLKVILV